MRGSVQRHDPAVGLYRRLLTLYPRRFRAEYGPHMLQVFGDCLRDARTQGQAGVAQLWLATLLDLIKSALEERTRRGITMTRDSFVRLSGPLWMLAGAMIAVGVFVSSFETRFSDPLGGPDLWFELAGFLWPAALLALLVGGVGFWLQHGERIGPLGRFALVGAGLGAIVSASGAMLMGLDLARLLRTDFGWHLFAYGMMVLTGNLILLGIAALQRRSLPRGNAVPLVLGLLPWLSFPLGDPAFEILLALFGGGWILFGITIQQGTAAAARPAVDS